MDFGCFTSTRIVKYCLSNAGFGVVEFIGAIGILERNICFSSELSDFLWDHFLRCGGSGWLKFLLVCSMGITPKKDPKKIEMCQVTNAISGFKP